MTVRIPFRWLLALLLIASAAIGVLAIRPAIDALAAARSRLAVARIVEASPPVAAPRRIAADPAALAARLRAVARDTGMLVESIAGAEPRASPLACADIALSGSGRAALRFAAKVEAMPVRFLDWRLAQDGAVVRLTGQACQVDAA